VRWAIPVSIALSQILLNIIRRDRDLHGAAGLRYPDRGGAVVPRARYAAANAGLGLRLSAARLHGDHPDAAFPGLAICYTVLAFNLFGDGLRDILDPRLAER
jgi:hypothetical protein